MNTGRRFWSFSLVLAMALAATPASGGAEDGTITLYWQENIAFEINASTFGAGIARWEIRVTDGAPVNVYFMRDWNYIHEYSDPLVETFNYEERHSRLNTTSFSNTIHLFIRSVSYLVIECAGLSAIDHSDVEYEVEWYDDTEPDRDYCFPAMAIVAAGAGGAGALLWWRRREGRAGHREVEPPAAGPPGP